jgi:general stress protein 26
MNREDGIRKVRDLIRGITFCMLTTVDGQGRLHSRPMAVSNPDEFDGQLWFFTYGRSHKCADVDRNHQVNCAFADPNDQTYVSVSGDASLVRDRDEIRRRWKPQYNAWFPNGVDEPDLALLRVTVERAEYWDSPSSLVAHAIGFVRTQVFGQEPDPGENKVAR